MFTEDSAISISAYDVHYLTSVTNTELVNILHWVTVKVVVNVEKTSSIMFSHRAVNDDLVITVNNEMF